MKLLTLVHDGMLSRRGRVRVSFAAFRTKFRPAAVSDLLAGGTYLGGLRKADSMPAKDSLQAERCAMLTALGWAGAEGLLNRHAQVLLMTDSQELIRTEPLHDFCGYKAYMYRAYGFIFSEQVRFLWVPGDHMKAFPYIGH